VQSLQQKFIIKCPESTTPTLQLNWSRKANFKTEKHSKEPKRTLKIWPQKSQTGNTEAM